MKKTEDANTHSFSHKQPPEWEQILKDVTYPRDWREAPWDTAKIPELYDKLNLETMHPMLEHYPTEEAEQKLEKVKQIAARKLEGVTKHCLMLYLLTNKNEREIGQMLGVHEDTVRRSIARAVKKIKECLEEPSTGEFPVMKGKRPRLRAHVFPLDTRTEKENFIKFINEKPIVHIAYRHDGLFHEAMAVYSNGKPGSR